MDYVSTIRKLYRHSYIEDIYNKGNFDITLTEFILQVHFQMLLNNKKFNASNILKRLPEKYKWIVQKILKHQIVGKPHTSWKKANDALKEALVINWCNEEDMMDYIQSHQPLRASV